MASEMILSAWSITHGPQKHVQHGACSSTVAYDEITWVVGPGNAELLHMFDSFAGFCVSVAGLLPGYPCFCSSQGFV